MPDLTEPRKAITALLVASLLLVLATIIACNSSRSGSPGAQYCVEQPAPVAGGREAGDEAMSGGGEIIVYPPDWAEITSRRGEIEVFTGLRDRERVRLLENEITPLLSVSPQSDLDDAAEPADALRESNAFRMSSSARSRREAAVDANLRHYSLVNPNAAVAAPAVPSVYSQFAGGGRAAEASRLRELPGAGGVFIGNDIDEVWVIVAPEVAAEIVQASHAGAESRPGCGALLCPLPPDPERPADAPAFVPVPLEHTGVSGSIQGSIASVSVTQRFANPFNEKIEAVYVFPLPHNAAVHDFVMTVGDRKIRGVIRERQQAERIYSEARAQGHVASLLTQERDNVFTQKVANIEPGKRIDVTIDYFHTLAYVDGWFEWAFPMVVAPRFNPPHVAGAGAGIGAAPQGAPGASGQVVEAQYLRPHQRSGHDIAIDLMLDTGFNTRDVRSASHQIRVKNESAGRKRVVLDGADTIPNKDFVLRFRAPKEPASGLVLRPNDGGDGGYFTLLLTPPEALRDADRAPVEFIFAIDTSGSMSGKPMHLAKQAILSAIDRLDPADALQIVTFAGHTTTWASGSQPATRENLRDARRFVEGLSAGGGTMMLNGINAALGTSGKTEGRERFIVFITDGLISNEHEILAAIHNDPSECRVFSFGIGSSTNRALLESMASVGRGAVAYIGLSDKASEIMTLFFDRVAHPALRHIEMAWGGLEVDEVFPGRIPDLMVGRPVLVHGTYRGSHAEVSAGGVRAVGFAGPRRIEIPVAISAPAGEIESRAMRSVWARARISDLALRSLGGVDAGWVVNEIRETALSHNLMSAFTAFVAVDSLSQTAGSSGVTVGVPVPVPQGVRYETTVPSGVGSPGAGPGGHTPMGMDDR
ncbi:MAG: VIT domain-containing protein [Phycisphaerales bacterium]